MTKKINESLLNKKTIKLLTYSVQEEFGFGREVEVDDVVQEWNVDTSSCQIGDDEDVRSPGFEPLGIQASGSRI